MRVRCAREMLIDELESDGRLNSRTLSMQYDDWMRSASFSTVVAEAVSSQFEILERNGSALLLFHLTCGGNLKHEDWLVIVDALSVDMHWECRLNICNSLVRRRDVFDDLNVEFAAFLRACAVARSSFLRAFGMSAFWALATRYPDYEDEALEIRERGRRDHAKCVVIRMRHLTQVSHFGA